ncbi:MAG: hypothetical protein OXT03_03890, partial [Alphaproteobacteria bacterium]|nr:hypothetical protein [Alphaproteobacteria bacterium]
QFLTNGIKKDILHLIFHQYEKVKETTSLPFGHENKNTKNITPLRKYRYFGIANIQVNYIGESKEPPELPDFNFEVIRDEKPIDGGK